MSNRLPDRTASEYIVNDGSESIEPPPPYSEFPTETSANNRQLANECIGINDHDRVFPSMPEMPEQTPQFTQPLPHPNMRTPLHFPNDFIPPPSMRPHRRPIVRDYSSQRAATRQIIDNEDDCCCTAPCEISTWGCLIYLTLFSLPFGIFCFIWTITTSIMCFTTLILPPLGYVMCLITAASYRMLGRIELVTQQLCGGQPRLFRNLGYQAYPPVFSLENPPTLPTTTTSLESRGWFNSSFSYMTDAYTWRCLVYFMMIKSFLSVITFIITILAVTISIPLALCLLGPALYLVKTVGVWQKEVAFEFLVL
ncbi:11616_t:CDS:2 [Funneliformis caledonium]|uniref:11616_t:CDS:1 n=2 Tax=Funneliformis TaxID=1117308 RepID=A0A9N9D2A2_9GLOM|nr:5604_t:CDS:2 [Funneliformis mosseae]CAG8619912.1 11616_t:CDS:2 [Funneliformis caledonium]